MFWVGGTLGNVLVSGFCDIECDGAPLVAFTSQRRREAAHHGASAHSVAPLETDAKQASVQLLKRQALGVWHADALSDVENAIGDLHFWPTTWSKDPRSRDYDMQRLGRSKRLDNRERFELFRFVVGNGASPALAVELLAASESLPDTFAITQMENLVKKAAEGSFSKYKAYIMADRKWAPVFCVPEQKPLPLGEYCPYEDARKVLARQKKRQ